MQSDKITHRKSRFGCRTCKQRKVKCDELRPSCGNCRRREVHCVYELEQAIIPRNPVTAVVSSAGSLDIDSLQLIHHFTTFMCQTLATAPEIQYQWQVQVPQLAFSNEPLLHSLLSVAALHLQVAHTTNHDKYHAITKYHYLQSLRPPKVANDTAQFLSKMINTLFFYVHADRDEDGLRSANSIRWQRRLFREAWKLEPSIRASDMGQLIKFTVELSHQQYPNGLLKLCSEAPDLDELDDPATLKIYQTSIEQLLIAWSASLAPATRYSAPFLWTHVIPEELVTFVDERRPRALVLFRYYYSMLKHVEGLWWFSGWYEDILSIDRILDEQWVTWINCMQ